MKSSFFKLTFASLALAVGVGIGARDGSSPETADKATASQAEEEVEFPAVEREANLGDSLAKSRSFMYAPPPMPHQGIKEGQCMNCHAPKDDIKKRWRAIRPIAHEHFTQCYQCHVSKSRDDLEPFVESDFLALDLFGGGSRNNEYAPPTVPHKVFMRENCLSCHGATGYSEYRTPHPERTQCMQCHVPEASVDYTRPQR